MEFPFLFHGGTLQQTATSTSCSPCGKSVGTPIRVWCTTFASENADLSSLGGQKLWRRRSSVFSKRDSPLVKLPGVFFEITFLNIPHPSVHHKNPSSLKNDSSSYRLPNETIFFIPRNTFVSD